MFLVEFSNMTVAPGSSLEWPCEVNQARRIDILSRRQGKYPVNVARLKL